MHREALWSAVLSEHVPERWLDEHRKAESDKEGGAQSEMDIILGGGETAQKTLISYS